MLISLGLIFNWGGPLDNGYSNNLDAWISSKLNWKLLIIENFIDVFLSL